VRDTGSMLQENFSDLSFDEWLETINTYEDENCTVDFLAPIMPQSCRRAEKTL